MSTLSPDRLRNRLGALARDVVATADAGDAGVRIEVAAAELMPLIEALREEPEGRRLELVDLTVVDHRDADRPRLDVVYRLACDEPRATLRLHARFDGADLESDADGPRIESVVGFWPVANWLEREAQELFGLVIRGHPGAAPLLLDGAAARPPLARTVVDSRPAGGAS